MSRFFETPDSFMVTSVATVSSGISKLFGRKRTVCVCPGPFGAITRQTGQYYTLLLMLIYMFRCLQICKTESKALLQDLRRLKLGKHQAASYFN